MNKVTNPKIGERVKPGPNWLSHWGHHKRDERNRQVPDATGYGTIVAIKLDGERVDVQWDAGKRIQYNTGHGGLFRLSYAEDPLMKVLEL